MSKQSGMNTDWLIDLVGIYGSDLDRWPAADREKADQAMPMDEALEARLADEQRLDAWLNTYKVPAPSAALMGRILAAGPQPQPLWRLSPARLWLSVGLIVSAALSGGASGAFALTLAAPALFSQVPNDVELAQTIFGSINLNEVMNE